MSRSFEWQWSHNCFCIQTIPYKDAKVGHSVALLTTSESKGSLQHTLTSDSHQQYMPNVCFKSVLGIDPGSFCLR